MRFLLILIPLLMAAPPASAVDPREMLADPLLETRAREISKGLRCVVCQNQSIDDSDATLARDLRVLVRERLRRIHGGGSVLRQFMEEHGPVRLTEGLAPGGRHGHVRAFGGAFRRSQGIGALQLRLGRSKGVGHEKEGSAHRSPDFDPVTLRNKFQVCEGSVVVSRRDRAAGK